MDLQRLEQAVVNVTCRYREAGYFPDAAVRVFNREKSLVTFCAGNAKDTSLFDVASLTKIATATMVLRLVDQGAFRLEDEITRLLRPIGAHPYLQARMKGITLEMLLTHTSTLTDWYPFYSRCGEDFYEALAYALSHTEVTRGVVYSDLNFMILGKLLEETLRKPLSVCLQEELVQPLGLGDMMFCPQERERIIPADYGNAIEMNMCRERNISFDGFRPLGVPAPGMVNDGNSHYYFGDVAGHAGIYATTESYMRLCQYYMTTSSELLIRAQKEQPVSPERGLGLQTGMTYPYGCGHTGFTGTSIYFSREKNIGCVAFTNRLFFPEANHHNTGEFRRALHETVFALGAEGL